MQERRKREDNEGEDIDDEENSDSGDDLVLDELNSSSLLRPWDLRTHPCGRGVVTKLDQDPGIKERGRARCRDQVPAHGHPND